MAVRAAVLLILAALSNHPSLAEPGKRPSDCPIKYAVCLSEAEARTLAVERAELEMRRSQVTALQEYIESMQKMRSGWRTHIGLGVAFGPPIAYCPDLGNAQACISVTLGLVWRF